MSHEKIFTIDQVIKENLLVYKDHVYDIKNFSGVHKGGPHDKCQYS